MRPYLTECLQNLREMGGKKNYEDWYEAAKKKRRERYQNDPEYRERSKQYSREYYQRVTKGRITAKKEITPIEPTVQFTNDGRRIYHDFEDDETETLILDQRREREKRRLLNKKNRNKDEKKTRVSK